MSRLGARQKRALAAVPTTSQSFVRQSPEPSINRWSNAVGYTELYWRQIQSILQNAERGYTEQWGDFTRRMLKTNAHLFSLYETRNNSIASARREVTARKVPPQYADFAKRAAEDCEELLSNLPNVERSISELLDADWTGYALQEIIWRVRGDTVVCDSLVWIHPREIRFANDFSPYIWAGGQGAARASELGIEPDQSNGVLGLPLTPNKYIVHMPRIMPDYPTSNGILLSCVRPWFVSSWVTKYALSGAETAGNPRTVGKIPEDAPAAVQSEMYEALESLAADGIAVLRGTSTVDILDPKMASDGGIWETLVKRQDAAMSKAALGSTLNVEIGDTGGAYAAAESQADVTISPRWAKSGASVANTIERQLFKPFLEFNRHRYGGMVFVPQLLLHIIEADPVVDDAAINAGVVTVDELRRSRKLEPLGEERGGNELVKPESGVALPSLGMPEPAPLPEQTGPDTEIADVAAASGDVAGLGLNGAQIKELKQLIIDVATKILPRESALGIISVAFPTVTREQANQMMPADNFVPSDQSAEAPAATPLAMSAANPRAPLTRPWTMAVAKIDGSDVTPTSGH